MFRLQSAQRIMLTYEKTHPDSTTYHLTSGVNLSGNIDLSALKQAIKSVMERHIVLRSKITHDHEEDSAVFSVLPDDLLPTSEHWPLRVIDAKDKHIDPEADFKTTLSLTNETIFLTDTFRFEQEPLWRCLLIQLDEDKYQFIVLAHHLILDGPSIGILFNDISAAYNQLKNPIPSPQARIPSLERIDFSIDNKTEQERITYWRHKLDNLNNARLMPDFNSDGPFNFNGKRIPFTISQETISQLTQTYPQYSVNNILLALLYLTINRYSNESDLTVGITSANRRHDERVSRSVLENQLINSFFNSLALRVDLTDTQSFEQLLALVKSTIQEGLQNQLPLDVVIQEALPAKTKSALRTAVPFSVMLVVNEEKPTLKLTGVDASTPTELDLGHCKFLEFGINCDALPDGSYRCFLEYNTEKFLEKTMHRFIDSFLLAAKSVMNNPNTELANIPILSKQQEDAITEFNDTSKSTTFHGFIPNLLQQQAKSYPHRSAIHFHKANGIEKESVSYKEATYQARQLAFFLLNSKMRNGNKNIGICLSRSNELIVSIYGVMLAGMTLVPLDTNSSAKCKQALDNTETNIVLVDSTTQSQFSDSSVSTINIDDINVKQEITQSKSDNLPALRDSTPAYIMHTSGTTDTPKGVVVSHGSLRNLLNSMRYDQSIRPMSQVICTALPTFDAFFYDMLVALTSGGALHLCPEQDRYSPTVLSKIITKEKINYGVFLPPVLDNLDTDLPLTHVVSMGSLPHKDTLKKWAAANKVIENGLGHTETGICLALRQYQIGDDHTLIGKPIRNMHIYILNADGGLCPIGVAGEIFVSGPGLANGYLNNEDANNAFKYANYDKEHQRYIMTDQSDKNAIRLYASGDYGCLEETPDGSYAIKFLGRKDRQLKIHGVRVELDALESTLRRHPDIKDIVAIPTPERNGLIFYVLPHNNSISSQQMRESICDFLSATAIPIVAYPKTVTMIRKIPVSKNGKVDKSQLPLPIQVVYPKSVAQLSPLATLLRKLWASKKVLNVPEDSIDTSLTFEELGGNSISIAALETKLNQARKHNALLSNLPSVSIELLHPRMTIASLEKKLKQYALIQTNTARRQPKNNAFFAREEIDSTSSSEQQAPQSKTVAQQKNAPF